MTAGLPGTGISCIFYFLLTLFMPIREFVALCKGRSSWRRWRLIGQQWGMLAGMVGGMWGWAWLVNQFCLVCIDVYAGLAGGGAKTAAAAQLLLPRTGALLYVSAFGSLISLSAVISAVFLARSVVRWRKSGVALQSASKPVGGLQPTLAQVALRESVSFQPAK